MKYAKKKPPSGGFFFVFFLIFIHILLSFLFFLILVFFHFSFLFYFSHYRFCKSTKWWQNHKDSIEANKLRDVSFEIHMRCKD